MGVASAGLQAAVLGSLAAYLTYSFTGPLGLHWELKDYGFVGAVTLAVFYNRLRTQKYEGLMQAEQTKQMSQAPELRRIEFVHGQPVQLELNKVTCLLFFVSCWFAWRSLRWPWTDRVNLDPGFVVQGFARGASAVPASASQHHARR